MHHVMPLQHLVQILMLIDDQACLPVPVPLACSCSCSPCPGPSHPHPQYPCDLSHCFYLESRLECRLDARPLVCVRLVVQAQHVVHEHSDEDETAGRASARVHAAVTQAARHTQILGQEGVQLGVPFTRCLLQTVQGLEQPAYLRSRSTSRSRSRSHLSLVLVQVLPHVFVPFWLFHVHLLLDVPIEERSDDVHLLRLVAPRVGQVQ